LKNLASEKSGFTILEVANMAWIKTIDEADATGELKVFYDEHMGERGVIQNIQKIHSIKPHLLKAYRAFSRSVTFGATALGRRREEMLAVMISALLKCRY
jgi:hypothetical protein